MIKRAHYSEIIFGAEHYIGGVNIFGELPFRTYIAQIKLQLPLKVSYGLIDDAQLYLFKFKRCKFRLAIKKITETIHIISYFSERSLRLVSRVMDKDDRKRNEENLRQDVLKNFKDYYVPDKYTIYTRDFMRRFVFKAESDCVKVWE